MFRVAVRARPDDHYAFPIESIVKKEITRGTVKKKKHEKSGIAGAFRCVTGSRSGKFEPGSPTLENKPDTQYVEHAEGTRVFDRPNPCLHPRSDLIA